MFFQDYWKIAAVRLNKFQAEIFGIETFLKVQRVTVFIAKFPDKKEGIVAIKEIGINVIEKLMFSFNRSKFSTILEHFEAELVGFELFRNVLKGRNRVRNCLGTDVFCAIMFRHLVQGAAGIADHDEIALGVIQAVEISISVLSEEHAGIKQGVVFEIGHTFLNHFSDTW